MKRLNLRVATAAALTTLLVAVTSAQADTRSDILAAEESFATALASRSPQAMTQVMSEDFLYQHVTGSTFTRADIVRIFGSGEITVTKAGPLKAELRDYGDTVISFGTRWFEGELRGQAYAGNLRFVNVWHKSADGRWLLTHRNSELLN